MSTINAKISKILVPLDDSELAMKAADYALLITKGLNAELLAIHVVRSEDALIATNSLIEDLETVTTEDSLLQRVKKDVQKWFNAIKEKSSANGIQLKTGLVISPTGIEDAIVSRDFFLFQLQCLPIRVMKSTFYNIRNTACAI